MLPQLICFIYFGTTDFELFEPNSSLFVVSLLKQSGSVLRRIKTWSVYLYMVKYQAAGVDAMIKIGSIPRFYQSTKGWSIARLKTGVLFFQTWNKSCSMEKKVVHRARNTFRLVRTYFRLRSVLFQCPYPKIYFHINIWLTDARIQVTTQKKLET